MNQRDTLAALYSAFAAYKIEKKMEGKLYFEKYIKNGGTDAGNFKLLALTYIEERNFSKAIIILRLGIDKCTDKKDLQNELVNVYLSSGQTSNATAYLETLISEYPSNSTYLLNLSNLYSNSGNKNLAKSYYKKTLQINPHEYDALYNLGVEYYNEAAEIKKQVDNMDLSTYNSRGKTIEKNSIGKWKESLIFFERAYAIRNYECNLVENLNTIYNLLYQAKEETQKRNVKCHLCEVFEERKLCHYSYGDLFSSGKNICNFSFSNSESTLSTFSIYNYKNDLQTSRVVHGKELRSHEFEFEKRFQGTIDDSKIKNIIFDFILIQHGCPSKGYYKEGVDYKPKNGQNSSSSNSSSSSEKCMVFMETKREEDAPYKNWRELKFDVNDEYGKEGNIEFYYDPTSGKYNTSVILLLNESFDSINDVMKSQMRRYGCTTFKKDYTVKED
jgi:hypothetical protein